MSDSRVDEHRNLGIAFYKTGMLDEAMREFRRVAELREHDSASRFYIGLALSRQGKWEEAVTAFRECVAQPGARAAGAAQSRVRARAAGPLRRSAERRSTKRCGAAARRTRASRRRSASSRCAPATWSARTRRSQVARPLFGTRPPTPAWFHYAALTAALLGDLDRARRAAAGRDRGASARGGAAQQPRGGARAARLSPRGAAGGRARRARGRRSRAAAQESRRLPLPRGALRRCARVATSAP